MQYKKGVKISLIILCMLVLLFAAGCNSQEDAVQSHGMSFRENSVTVEKYETCTLELQGAEGKQIEWKSNDESVATVQDGVVCGWKKGNTQILACVDGVEVSCNIIVTDNQYVPVLKLRDSDELALDLGGTYSLQPVLYYNAKEYAEVQYTYSCVGNAVTVDENGVIHAAEAGEAMVCVQGKWRGNVVDASLTVYVIDVSTAVEVSGKVFDIYLNSRDEEFPASADLGISVFDKDTPVQEKDASIKYIELIMAGDVAGAATVENGVVYSKKLGTTHFVAEYTPAEGEAVRTTVFTVNVHKCPADIYMEPIAGAEYESFITPLNAINSVKWDEEMGAFHLTNKNAGHDDGRGFLFSGDYIENILRYTNAKSLVFEVKGDGIHSGIEGANQFIYQAFYPDWYDAGEYLMLGNTDKWQKIEIFFDDIPLDQNGKRKSIMLLSTVEGMYVRNICPMTEGSFLTMDLELTTLGGNWTKDIEIGLYPHSYEGGINDYNNRVTIKAGVKTTVKVRLDDFLEGGKVPGFGLVVYGGPEWNTELADGTFDRHTLKITNLRVTGEQNYSLDLSIASWVTGKNGTGFTDANGSGVPHLEDGTLIIENGFRYDGHKITLDSVDPKERTNICFDMLLTTLGNSTDYVDVCFYPNGFEGDIFNDFTEKISVVAGKETTVKLNLDKYLVDGQFPGIGVAIFGGPEWNTEFADGKLDRHNVVISNMRLEGKQEKAFNLDQADIATGFANANGGGIASVMDGKIYITDGYRYDGHMITFDAREEVKTHIGLDMLITTLSNSTERVDVCFYPYGFAGDIFTEHTEKIAVTAGTQTTVKLNLDNYLIDGEFSGIGFAIFGGPEWNTELSDGAMDRHNVVISNMRLEGEQEKTFDLNDATITTGFANANGGGAAMVVDGTITVTGGYRYDGHMISLNEVDTYLKLDMLLTTLSNSTDRVDVCFYPYNFEGDIYTGHTDKFSITAGTQTTLKLDMSKYLVDGELSGIGVAIFGGPEWNTELADGTLDRHNVVISNIRLEGELEKTIDLSNAVVVTGFANANAGGAAVVVDGMVNITGGYRYDGHMITFADETIPEETEPEVTEPEVTEPPVEEPDTYISLDVLINTVGNSTDPIEVRFYPYNYEGSVHSGYTDLVTVTAGTTTTVKLDASNYLVNGELTGIGFGIFGGPEWNDAAGDRHTVAISNVKLEGEQSVAYDLSQSKIVSGNNGTGYTDANGWGSATIGSSIVITGGIRYDAHKISLVKAPDTYIVLDMLLTTLGNSNERVEIGFFPYNFTGDINNNTDKIAISAGAQTTVKLDLSKYLVDGELPGIGFVIFGGPEWNTQLADGTYDRHSLTISSVKLEGKDAKDFDLSQSVWTKGSDAGYTNANGSGEATIGDAIVITNGFRYDGHKIFFADETIPEETEPEETEPEETEPPVEECDTYISLDVLINTVGNSTDPIEVRFYPYNYEGSVHNGYTDLVTVTAGTTTTVKLDASNYLVNGELTGIGFGIFGGPEWNDAAGDRHTVTISNVKLEGEQSVAYDLSQSKIASGNNGTGYTDANGWGSATIGSSIVITGGIRYDAHKISLVKAPDTYIVLDMLLTTLGNSNERVEIGFFPYNFTGDINGNTDKIAISAGTQTTVKLDLSKYLVDGELPGIGFAIFGGPEWNTQLSDGTYDRHSLTISSVKLEGKDAKAFDLSQSAWVNGGTAGYTNANGSGTAEIGSSIVITNGFRYDGHKISLVEDTNSYITMDMQIDTVGGNWTNDIEIRFYPYGFEGNPHETYTDIVMFRAGEQQTVKLDAEKYLVDGKLTGIGIGIFGGPEWNTQISDGVYDRHTVTISNVKLEGADAKSFDLSQSTCISGTTNTGYTVANGSGVGAFADGVYQITNGFRYDCHKISLVEKAEPGQTEQETYIVMDLLLTTLSNSTNPVEIRFCNYNQEESVHTTYTDILHVTAGTKTTVRLKVDNYLVDGELPGFSIGIFGGPEWNTQISAGVYDRHSVVISDLRLEGAGARDIDLSAATVATGIPGSNSGGSIAIVDGQIVITGGFRYDGHRITLG